MSFPDNTAEILIYLGYDPSDFMVAADGGGTVIREWAHADPMPTEQDINDAALGAAKHFAKEMIRSEAQSLILKKWPWWKQSNAQLGLYPAAVVEACQDDIAAVIQASNAAEDAIDAAATIEAVEAVSASWPVI